MRVIENTPQSICIFRLSALGDATHVVPVIRRLQNHWPDTKITWIIGSLEYRLLKDMAGIEFIVFNKRGGWDAIRHLRLALKGRTFDVLLQMQVAARANILSRFVKAPVRLGWDSSRSRDFHSLFVNQQINHVPFQHQVEGFLEFSNALGVPPAAPTWELPISSEAKQWADRQIKPGKKTLLISPCSSHALRNWQSRYYAKVADFAIAERGMQVILSGGPSEFEINTGTEIENHMQENCLNLIGKDTLEQSKALLSKADLLISPDSGPAHIASALGTPVIGLYAATWSRRSGPYNSLDLCVDHFEAAARQFRNKKPEELRWGTRIEVPGVMDLIQPEEVIDKINKWWNSEHTTLQTVERPSGE